MTSSTKEQDLATKSYFITKVDVEQGSVIGVTYQKKTKIDYSSSEVVFNQIHVALKESGKKPSNFQLREWRDVQVSNADTRDILLHVLQKQEGGGEHEYVTGAQTYQRGSLQFEALQVSTLGQQKGFYEAQHQEFLQGKRFTSVTVNVQARPHERKSRFQQSDKAPHPLDRYEISLSWRTDA